MTTTIFYILVTLVVTAQLLVFWLKSPERLLALSIIQLLLALPLLACQYFLFAISPMPWQLTHIFFTEAIVSLVLFSFALRLGTIASRRRQPRTSLEVAIWAGAILLSGFVFVKSPDHSFASTPYSFPQWSPVYLLNVFLLLFVFYAGWRLEQFWRFMDKFQREPYKFFVTACVLTFGSFIWACSYRLAFLVIIPDHLLLLSALLAFSWIFIVYAVLRYRLLNRKVFVSRKVVYSFLAPAAMALYLLCFGLLCVIMRAFGLELSLVVKGMAVAMGFVAVSVLGLSERVRRRVRFFISTHFYINKYEYRDEWLALSRRLHGVITEKGIVDALKEVLEESLYTDRIIIWLGDKDRGYHLVSASGKDTQNFSDAALIPSSSPIVKYLESRPFLLVNGNQPHGQEEKNAIEKAPFLKALGLELLCPLIAGTELVGIVALGPEFTGGSYGQDDFDLLSALGSQAASAILAARMSEKLSRLRQEQTWDRLSAFVLHDIKNASSMLALLLENAPENLHDPDFQQDMLELIDDALKRMNRVQERLRTLKDEIMPKFQEMDLSEFLMNWCKSFSSRLPRLDIRLDVQGPIPVKSDPALLSMILENLLLNSFEAGGDATRVRISAYRHSDREKVILEIRDNGPGIPEELLPEGLFAPFTTTKESGSGVGLWQVKRLVTALGGKIRAENMDAGGAVFVVELPT